MHWINDIALAQNNTAVVTASSDLTVKVWRPHSQENNLTAHTVGEHSDYVKCVATPPTATGGLDRKICLWDLNGAGKTLEIDVKGEETQEKGSVYALSVGRSFIASGGPEQMIRLYDPRTGSRVSKLVGHVGNIRSILIDEAGDTVLSASADKTIKMWSVKGGRCMYTFTMHDESIWSLFSDDPQLGIFYSSDRSGLVVKTDVRGSLDDIDDGLSVAVAQEVSGVVKTVASHGSIWTATNHSSINRWRDIDTGPGIQLPESLRHYRAASLASNRPRQESIPSAETEKKCEIPAEAILRISNTAFFPPRSVVESEAHAGGEAMTRKGSEVIIASPPEHDVKPIRHSPEETIEGHFGLLKHKLLNDRRRVLTLDTAGDVVLWDLIKVSVRQWCQAVSVANRCSANQLKALASNILKMLRNSLIPGKRWHLGVRLT
jgi:WD repeat-containing protein 48